MVRRIAYIKATLKGQGAEYKVAINEDVGWSFTRGPSRAVFQAMMK
jgi:hypothetical protein